MGYYMWEIVKKYKNGKCTSITHLLAAKNAMEAFEKLKSQIETERLLEKDCDISQENFRKIE